jgi:prepilin-type N-terminal cleavage/methylation domain-containing protein/prepilin-type processing-associated H-X9-DG protein
MYKNRSRGFTLIELLVVIAIIGVLMALLLPAIQSARESGRKTACMSNAYQLGMAVNRFDQDKGKVPGWAQPLSTRVVGWPVMCLPYIERNDLYAEWTNGNTNFGTIGVFICPSAPVNQLNVAPLSYVANCGNQGDASPSLYCGVMANNYSTSYSLEDVSDGDGTATTLLFGEKALGSGYDMQKIWNWHSPPQNPNTVLYGIMNFSNSNNNSMVDPATSAVLSYVYGYPAFGLPTTAPGQNLRSAHTGGSVVAFCDGHTYFLGNDINTDVYIQLVTSNGGRLPTGNDYKVGILNESDF